MGCCQPPHLPEPWRPPVWNVPEVSVLASRLRRESDNGGESALLLDIPEAKAMAPPMDD